MICYLACFVVVDLRLLVVAAVCVPLFCVCCVVACLLLFFFGLLLGVLTYVFFDG